MEGGGTQLPTVPAGMGVNISKKQNEDANKEKSKGEKGSSVPGQSWGGNEFSNPEFGDAPCTELNFMAELLPCRWATSALPAQEAL